ncbi:glycosyltransferase [Lentimicrobium sp. S6]|uniref:glycosyltransferase n=1 Tax=Lentimicrobium sp. S6 TaxID=2735872 RepID=UPI0015531CC3|nr:glycosyltransferase [Lentimicrobium sp. S6]NPD46740.1 glycosyltransferase [Lentimicrobium sp. S6]
MKILVNGYFYGGNCPPFLYYLKKFNNDIKLTNSLSILEEHGVNTDFISYDDLLPLRLNWFEKFLVKYLKKARIKLWMRILTRKSKQIIKEYNPDIIINHKISEKSEIMLKTGFQPQISYIYGGEVHGDRIFSKSIEYSFSQSKYVLTATAEIFNYVVKMKPESKNYLKQYPLGTFNYKKVLTYKNNCERAELRKEYNIPRDQTVFIDSRSLRSINTGVKSILHVIKKLAENAMDFTYVFLRGHLGTDQMIKYVNDYIDKNKSIRDNVIIVDKVISNDEIRDYYYLSDCFVSLLPHDQFGSSIMDALFLDCHLILTDLEAYRNELSDSALYVQNQDLNKLEAYMKSIVVKQATLPNEEIKHFLSEKYGVENNYSSLYKFINKIVNE